MKLHRGNVSNTLGLGVTLWRTPRVLVVQVGSWTLELAL